MKSTLKKSLLLIGILILLIFLLVIFLKKPTDIPFNRIKLNEDNIIVNRATQPYLDTIVNVGLDELNIQKILVVIRPITSEIKTQLNQKETDLDVKAFIVGKNNQYIIYIVDMDRNSSMDVISHELIHLQQTESGRLVKGTQSVIWEGIEYSSQIEYDKRPWEIDAYSNSNDLKHKIQNRLIK